MLLKTILWTPLLYCSIVESLATHVLSDADAQWKNSTSIPTSSLQEHSTVIIDSTLYVLGGIVPDTTNSSGRGGLITTGRVQAFHIPTQTWRECAPIPLEMNHPNVAVANERIYVLGGLTPTSGRLWLPLSNGSYEYTPKTDTWRALNPLPVEHARGSAAVAVYNNIIYLAGGLTVIEQKLAGLQDSVDWVSAYDPQSDTFLDLPPQALRIPDARDHVGVGVVDGTMYLLGGRVEGAVNVRDTVFSLDLRNPSDGWMSRTAMPTARGGVSTAVLNNKIYVFGGEENPEEGAGGMFYQVEAYDPKKNLWEKLERMPLPVHGTYAVSYCGKIYLPGGATRPGGGATDAMQVFTPRHGE